VSFNDAEQEIADVIGYCPVSLHNLGDSYQLFNNGGTGAMNRVLLVGDPSLESGSLSAALQLSGYTVHHCETGIEALEQVSSMSVTCCISALSPGETEIDSIRLLQRLKQADSTVTTAILIEPAEVDELARIQTADVDAILTTQFSFDQVKTTLTQANTDTQIQNASLHRTTLLTTLVRTCSLLGEADSLSNAEQLLCDQIADSDWYTAAWVTHVDPETQDTQISTAVGIPTEFLKPPTRIESIEWEMPLQINATEEDSEPGTEVRIPIGTQTSPYAVVHLVTEREIGADERDALQLLGTVLSLTYRADTNDVPQSADTDLKRYSRVIAHELGNHLQVAGMLLSDKRDDDLSDDRALIEDVLERIERVTRTAALIAEGTVETENLATQDLRETAQLAWSRFNMNDATLEVADSSSIVADHDLLVVLLENLYRNSVEHAESDVVVTIGLLGDEDGFYVEDTGSGISTNNRDQVFEWGYSTNDSGGYGLAIVRQIATAHGWNITVAESEEGGARFEIKGVSVA